MVDDHHFLMPLLDHAHVRVALRELENHQGLLVGHDLHEGSWEAVLDPMFEEE